MSEQFKIVGAKPLSGRVTVGGSKNAAFPLLAASVLCSTPLILDNVPNILDIKCFLSILSAMGAEITRFSDNRISINSSKISTTEVPVGLASQIRGSYYLLGSLLSKFGKAKICFPGGCNIGERPIDLHIESLSKLGHSFEVIDNLLINAISLGQYEEKYHINLPFPSRGATINILLAIANRQNIRVLISNANTSPETICLCKFLQERGVFVSGLGTPELEVIGTSKLEGGSFSVPADKIEAATLICAGLITRGSVCIDGIISDDIQPFLEKLISIGYKPTVGESSVKVSHTEPLNVINIISGLQPPAIDADWEPLLASLLCTIQGTSIVQDKINPQRHARFIPQLKYFGADITIIDDQTALIKGGINFRGAIGKCEDIRGGAALTLAALAAEGCSEIRDVEQIDRGYEQLSLKLKTLGANIMRSETSS